MTGPRSYSGKRQRGMTYLWVLFAVMVLGLGMGKVLEVQHLQRQREKEAELLWVGEQYRLAIRSYYLSSPGTLKRYPPRLEDLLLDRRLLMVRRHIRRLYADPITERAEWGLVQNREGGIVGVFSLSEGQPIKRDGFSEKSSAFALAANYQQWKFTLQGQP